MGSGVTLSGFNNIDFGSIVTALMKQASEPLTVLQTRQNAINSQIKAMASLGTRVSSLKTASDDLGDTNTFSAYNVTSGDGTAVTAKTGAGAVAGHYEIQVLELARAQVTATNSTTPDANTTVVASGGTLTIGGTGVTLAGNVTLTGLADAINKTAGISVRASVVRSATNAYRLVLTSSATGQAGAFTVTNAMTGGTGITFTDTNANGTSGDSTADNAVQATDASALVNNIAVQSTTNEFSEAIPGVTFTVLKKDPAATIGLDVAADASSLKTKVNAFIAAYNNLTTFLSDQNTSAAQGDTASIGHAPIMRQLRGEIRGLLMRTTGPASVSSLSQAGVEFTQSGQLKLNDTVFTAAVKNHAADVQTLFTGTSGVFALLGTALKSYSQTGGFLATTTDQMNSQVRSLDTQIASMQARLAQQKLALQLEFSATDSLMTSLKSQSASLSSISGSMSLL